MDTFTRRFGLPRPQSESQAQTAIGNLILQSSTGMAMAPGISVAARDKRMNPNQPQAVRDEDMHPYYKPHLKNVDLADRIRRFHDSTQDKMSRVWAIDCCAKQGEVVLNGPFTSKGRLHQFIIDSERKPKDSRIFVADGTNSWSAALIGRECKVPVEFFLDSTDEQYVHLKPRKDMEAGCPVTMDNARIATIATRSDVSHRSIRFEALGNSEIQFQRSHIFFGNLPQWSRKTAVVLCNESHEYPLGEALVEKLMKDATKSERLCQDILWLMWDVYKEMNNWPHILELMKNQLTIEEKHAEHPELDLTEALHKDTAIHIELHEMIRVQIAVLDGFINTVTQKNPLLRSPAITQILDTKARLKRSQDVLEVLTKQTNNLISQVYNFMAIRESTSVGKLTWITLIYLPLSFAASLFSMSIQQLDPRPSVWAYVSFALVLSAITLAVAVGSTSVFQHRKKVLKEIHSYIHPSSSKLERVVVDQDLRSYRKSNVEEPGFGSLHVLNIDETTMGMEEKKKKYQELIHNLKAPPKPYSLINVQYHSKSQYATTENNPGPVSLDLALSTRQDEILSADHGRLKKELESGPIKFPHQEEVLQWRRDSKTPGKQIASVNNLDGQNKSQSGQKLDKNDCVKNGLGIDLGSGLQECTVLVDPIISNRIGTSSDSQGDLNIDFPMMQEIPSTPPTQNTDEGQQIPVIPIITIDGAPWEPAVIATPDITEDTDVKGGPLILVDPVEGPSYVLHQPLILPDDEQFTLKTISNLDEEINTNNENPLETMNSEATTLSSPEESPQDISSDPKPEHVDIENTASSSTIDIPSVVKLHRRLLKLRLNCSQRHDNSSTESFLIPYHEVNTWDKLRSAVVSTASRFPSHIQSNANHGIFDVLVEGAVVLRQFWESIIHHACEMMDAQQSPNDLFIDIMLEHHNSRNSKSTLEHLDPAPKNDEQGLAPKRLRRVRSYPELLVRKTTTLAKRPFLPSSPRTFPQRAAKSRSQPPQKPAASIRYGIGTTVPLTRFASEPYPHSNFIPGRLNRTPTGHEPMVTGGIVASRMHHSNNTGSNSGSMLMPAPSRFLSAPALPTPESNRSTGFLGVQFWDRRNQPNPRFPNRPR